MSEDDMVVWVLKSGNDTYATAYGSGSIHLRLAARFYSKRSATEWAKSNAPTYHPKPIFVKDQS